MKNILIILVVLIMVGCNGLQEQATDNVPKPGVEYKLNGGFELVGEKKPLFDTNSKYDDTYYIIREKETGVEYIYIPGVGATSAVLTRR